MRASRCPARRNARYRAPHAAEMPRNAMVNGMNPDPATEAEEALRDYLDRLHEEVEPVFQLLDAMEDAENALRP